MSGDSKFSAPGRSTDYYPTHYPHWGDHPQQTGDGLPTVSLGKGLKAIALGLSHRSACAVFSNQRVKCWGNNDGGILGLEDGQHRGDDHGEMGDNLPYVNLGAGKTVKSLTAGNFHFCAILNDDSLKCWGLNNYGQLGYGDTNNRGDQSGEMGDSLPAVDLGTGRHAVALSLGGFTTCALLDNGTVKCWGAPGCSTGRLGDFTVRVGAAPGEMGNALAPID